MPTYRITIDLKSPLGTGMVSGTLWGHLAWAIRYTEGESLFAQWLEVQESRPWLLSSQLPFGMIPRPLLKPASKLQTAFSLEKMQLEKKARKVKYIPESLFIELREQMSDHALSSALSRTMRGGASEKSLQRFGLKAHNHIDRLTGTTPQAGGLFFEEVELPSVKNRYQVFVQTTEPCLERLQALFAFIGENGFGANASSGNGSFGFSIGEEAVLFSKTGTRGLSLSHGLITADMQNSRYKQHVHYGKLGGDYAKGQFSPFKYPVLMAQPGATFDMDRPAPFGDLLHGVHHDEALAHIRHHAFHLVLGFTEVRS